MKKSILLTIIIIGLLCLTACDGSIGYWSPDICNVLENADCDVIVYCMHYREDVANYYYEEKGCGINETINN